jgi:hypothetical protein
MVEREMEVPEGKDVECFLDSVKAHLLRAGGKKNDAMRAAQKEVRVFHACSHGLAWARMGFA